MKKSKRKNPPSKRAEPEEPMDWYDGLTVRGAEDRRELPVYQMVYPPKPAVADNDSGAGTATSFTSSADYWFEHYNLHYELSRLVEPNLHMTPFLAMQLEIQNCTDGEKFPLPKVLKPKPVSELVATNPGINVKAIDSLNVYPDDDGYNNAFYERKPKKPTFRIEEDLDLSSILKKTVQDIAAFNLDDVD